jgi:HPt (histidine-containing phosphotransfer) domain-containing protein
VISIERIEELKSEVGEDDFTEILGLFVAESAAVLERLRMVVDPDEAEELLHALKGSALNIGFDGLAVLCREGGGALAGTPAWNTRFAQLLDMFERSRERLDALA